MNSKNRFSSFPCSAFRLFRLGLAYCRAVCSINLTRMSGMSDPDLQYPILVVLVCSSFDTDIR